MQLALREQRRLGIALGLWALLTVACMVTGPFGTLGTLSIAMRALYWGAIVGASIAGSFLIDRFRPKRKVVEVLLWVVFACVLATGVHVMNLSLFPRYVTEGQLPRLLFNVAAIVLVVHGTLWLAYFARSGVKAEAPDPAARFQRRLPLQARGALVRIEAQDHYLNVVTDAGSSLILLRLGEAMAELEGVAGLQVHRSHWVALAAVREHRREGGRDILVMSDGVEVPVARTRRAEAQEAGLF
jgi:hypothetical protein